MCDVLVLDSMSLADNTYGGDLRLLDSVLSATGFDALNFNFTPFNFDSLPREPARKKRKIAGDLGTVNAAQRFQCGMCERTFAARKTQNRHRVSVHKQEVYPCSICDRVFHRRDIRIRHVAETHDGRKRAGALVSNNSISREVIEVEDERESVESFKDEAFCDDQRIEDQDSVDIEIAPTITDLSSPIEVEEFESEALIQGPPTMNDILSSVAFPNIRLVDSPLLLCTHLLIRCKPYKKFYIHNKKRELVSRKKWREPDRPFCELYDQAIHSLTTNWNLSTIDPEYLAALAAFVNVDVLINGAERMGMHAKAMYGMKAHHRSRRDPIFDALEDAFEHCGKACRSIRIIYTKHGFVWMLNMGYRMLRIPID